MVETVGITGARGLLGWHVAVRLGVHEGLRIKKADRATFLSPQALQAFVTDCDVIVHLAGMNRGDEIELAETNVRIASQLIEACDAAGCTPTILFANSIQSEWGTAYGRSKARCAELIGAWAEARGARLLDLILPHIFGEGGRPFYNSVVSTFCHQIAHSEEPRILNDGQLELIHAGDVALEVLRLIEAPARPGTPAVSRLRIEGRPIRVTEMLARLKPMAEQYAACVVPDLRDPFDLRLFNTYRSYLFPQHYPVRLKLFTDPRGRLFEAVKDRNGGQVFLSTTLPGITRGNHFHFTKVERFLVVAGEAEIAIRRVGHPEIVRFMVNGSAPAYVDMPTLHTHNITNTGSAELLTLFWAHEPFDPNNPDTYPEVV
jgi:UDP-2-acetamido-2,6-beta-L-arabino-hexul-4-ose reductase